MNIRRIKLENNIKTIRFILNKNENYVLSIDNFKQKSGAIIFNNKEKSKYWEANHKHEILREDFVGNFFK